MSSPSRQVSSRRLPPLPAGPRFPLPYGPNSNGRQTSTTTGNSNTTGSTTSPTSSINNISGNGSTFSNELRAAMVGRAHERFANGVANKSNAPSYYHYHQNEPGIITTTTANNNSSNLLTATGKSSMTFTNIYVKHNHNSFLNA